VSEPDAGDDEQYVALQDPADGTVIAVPWRTQSDEQDWSEEVIDLSLHIGRSLTLYFNVYNDGTGGRTAMYIDDASLQVCSAPTVTATPSVTPTATSSTTSTPTVPMPAPSATWNAPVGPCRLSCLPNSDFETYDSWQLGTAPVFPTYLAGEGMYGSRAIRLGNEDQENIASYSSIRQTVHLPAWPAALGLRFWYRPLSEGLDADDYQELLLLQPDTQDVEARLWRITRDDRRWLQQFVDLSSYRGRWLSLYFNVINDGAGGRTAMYLDDVCLELCGDMPQQQPTRPRPTVQPPTPTWQAGTATATRRYRTPAPTATPSASRPAAPLVTLSPTPSAVPLVVQATATPSVSPGSIPTRRAEAVLPLTGVPALPAAFAGWSLLEWILATIAAVIALAALVASIRVIARYWIMPLLGRRDP
jgi:hypothetical protein